MKKRHSLFHSDRTVAVSFHEWEAASLLDGKEASSTERAGGPRWAQWVAAFQNEVEKALKARIPLQERNEWESWITTSCFKISALTAEIARLEAEINAVVYALFDLAPDEIELLNANA